MKELIGKTIKEVYINEDGTVMKFVTDIGDMYYECEGDCCSETWFADIISSNFFNFNSVSLAEYDRLVTDVEELEIPYWLNELVSKDERGRQDYDTVYGYKIKAVIKNDTWRRRDDCDLVIIFRNSSNGYYGGSVELQGEGRLSLSTVEDTYIKLTGDWRSE